MKVKTYFAMVLFVIAYHVSAQDIQRVRIDFETPNGFVRHLMLGFTPDNAANDNVNYGYDAPNYDNFPDDLNWIINDARYVIQGVGEFNVNKTYPLGLFLTNSGTFKIKLNALENFPEAIDVYIYDSLNNTFNRINDVDFEDYADSGNYLDRFHITFIQQFLPTENLSNGDLEFNSSNVKYLRHTKELVFEKHVINKIEQLSVYNVFGQNVFQLNNVNLQRVILDLQQTSSNIYIVKIKTSSGILTKKILF